MHDRLVVIWGSARNPEGDNREVVLRKLMFVLIVPLDVINGGGDGPVDIVKADVPEPLVPPPHGIGTLWECFPLAKLLPRNRPF